MKEKARPVLWAFIGKPLKAATAAVGENPNGLEQPIVSYGGLKHSVERKPRPSLSSDPHNFEHEVRILLKGNSNMSEVKCDLCRSPYDPDLMYICSKTKRNFFSCVTYLKRIETTSKEAYEVASNVSADSFTPISGNVFLPTGESLPCLKWNVSSNIEDNFLFNTDGLNYEEMEFEPHTYFSFNELLPDDDGAQLDRVDPSENFVDNMDISYVSSRRWVESSNTWDWRCGNCQGWH
ncbi:hypothetical protein POM88_026490 [Heracleum sosnowskyi]|uniref:Uncharacterized protein n=1 Tax=Heracleum sosnowskyi TaxID=360622 RepID=A0AAD8I634_9APIA|nr:hypothetical protein POM88_026490 [Heracleum sosnowskyi]